MEGTIIRQTIRPPQDDVGHRPEAWGRIEVCYRS
jgi:hypothetical protein